MHNCFTISFSSERKRTSEGGRVKESGRDAHEFNLSIFKWWSTSLLALFVSKISRECLGRLSNNGVEAAKIHCNSIRKIG